jgi:lipopolysaccharide transport system permease protein
MIDVVYSAGSDLRRPGRFLRDAAADLRNCGPIGWRLFLHDFRARHRRSALGYAWLVLPAAATALLCTYVRTQKLVTIGPTDLPYPVFVLAGVLLWQTFVDAINAPLKHLAAARPLITRSRLALEGVFTAALLEMLVNTAVRLAIVFAALLLFRVSASPSALLVPLGAGSLLLLGFAIGLLIAPLGMLYDDVPRGIALATTFLLFVTPVLYPIPYHGPFRLNPVTPLLDTSRGWLVGSPASPGFGPVLAASLVVSALAWLALRLARPRIVERLC